MIALVTGTLIVWRVSIVINQALQTLHHCSLQAQVKLSPTILGVVQATTITTTTVKRASRLGRRSKQATKRTNAVERNGAKFTKGTSTYEVTSSSITRKNIGF